MSWLSEKICQIQNTFFGQKTTTTTACEVDEGAQISPNATTQDSVRYSDLTVAKLRVIAKQRSLKGYTTVNKAELIEMLQQN